MKDPLIILVVILVVVIIWRGPKTLPQIGNMLGRGVKEARREAAEIKDDIHKDDSPAVAVAPVAPPVAPLAPVAPPVPPVPPAPPVAGPPGTGTPGPGAAGPA
jgi:hypothetical protein